MPIYAYRCLDCKETTEVVRKLNEWDRPPDAEEFPKCRCDPETEGPAWERYLKGAPKANYGYSWAGGGGGKGKW